MKARVDLPDLLDYAEAGKVLGLKRPMVYVLVAEGKLRPLMVQRRKVFARDDVLALKAARLAEGGKARERHGNAIGRS